MDDIAKASGIPRATLYYYFSGKDEVLAFLLRSMLDDLRISVSTALEIEGGAKTRLEGVVRAQLAHLAANPSASRLLIMNLGKAGQLGAIASGVETGFRAPVRRVLQDGILAGEVSDVDLDVVATAVYGAVTMVGLQALLVDGQIEVDALTASLFPVIWGGIARLRSAPQRTPS